MFRQSWAWSMSIRIESHVACGYSSSEYNAPWAALPVTRSIALRVSLRGLSFSASVGICPSQSWMRTAPRYSVVPNK